MYTFDLYLSYSPQEAQWVRAWLLPRLEKAGLRVFLDTRDARPGASKIAEMERAMLESAKTLLVLTPAYLQGDWNDFQSIMVQYLDPAGRQQRLIPLILKAVDLPLRLNMLVPLDFTEHGEQEAQLGRLLGAFGKEWESEVVEAEGLGAEVSGNKGTVEKRRSEDVGLSIRDPVVRGVVRDLAGHLQRGRLVLFVGPDLSQSLTGAPERQMLADRLAQEKGLPPGQSLSAIAQQVMVSGNRFEFTAFLKRQMTGLQPGPFYRALAGFVKTAFPQGTIITTAYHRLLEAALEGNGVYSLQTVTTDSMLPFLEPKTLTLFKLYGDIQQADLIVTEQDQNALVRGRAADRQDMVDEVARLFKRNCMLFLGVNLRDPVVLALFDDVAGGKFQIPAFALWRGLSEGEKQAFESNRGVKVLEVDERAVLEHLGVGKV